MGMTHYMELMMGSWYLLVLFITRAVKPVPSGGAHFTDIVNWLSKFKKSPWQSSHTVQTSVHRTARPSSAYRYRLGR